MSRFLLAGHVVKTQWQAWPVNCAWWAIEPAHNPEIKSLCLHFCKILFRKLLYITWITGNWLIRKIKLNFWCMPVLSSRAKLGNACPPSPEIIFRGPDVQLSPKYRVKTKKRLHSFRRPIFPPKFWLHVLRHGMGAPHRETEPPFTCGLPPVGGAEGASFGSALQSF